MKVAVTSTGPELTSAVDPRFGRAKWFVIVDTESGEHEAVDNARGVSAGSGAGVQAAESVASRGAKYVLTGHCGPNAFRTLGGAGITVVTGAVGTVSDAVGKFKAGDFEAAPGADVEGHQV